MYIWQWASNKHSHNHKFPFYYWKETPYPLVPIFKFKISNKFLLPEWCEACVLWYNAVYMMLMLWCDHVGWQLVKTGLVLFQNCFEFWWRLCLGVNFRLEMEILFHSDVSTCQYICWGMDYKSTSVYFADKKSKTTCRFFSFISLKSAFYPFHSPKLLVCTQRVAEIVFFIYSGPVGYGSAA